MSQFFYEFLAVPPGDEKLREFLFFLKAIGKTFPATVPPIERRPNYYYIIYGSSTSCYPNIVCLIVIHTYLPEGKYNLTNAIFQDYLYEALKKQFPDYPFKTIKRYDDDYPFGKLATQGLTEYIVKELPERKRQLKGRKLRNDYGAIHLYFSFADLAMDYVCLHNISLPLVLEVLISMMRGKPRGLKDINEIDAPFHEKEIFDRSKRDSIVNLETFTQTETTEEESYGETTIDVTPHKPVPLEEQEYPPEKLLESLTIGSTQTVQAVSRPISRISIRDFTSQQWDSFEQDYTIYYKSYKNQFSEKDFFEKVLTRQLSAPVSLQTDFSVSFDAMRRNKRFKSLKNSLSKTDSV